MPVANLARLFAFLAGTSDLLSGILFMASPSLIARCLGPAVLSADGLVFMRFVGACVAAIGLLCLWAAHRGGALLRASFELTQFVRASTGVFVVVAVGLDWLPMPWMAIALADSMIIGAQTWFLKNLPSYDGS